MPRNQSENQSSASETLRLHREMYQRRLNIMRQRGGLSEKELTDLANHPQTPERSPVGAESDVNDPAEVVR